MRMLAATLALAAALTSLPASADHGRHGYVRPYVGFGYSYGYPFGYGYPFDYGYPFGYGFGFGYGPFYYPRTHFGVGVVVAPHRAQREKSARPASGDATSALKLYVYPANGQTEKQTADDRYACHTWAVSQSGYDPTLGAGKKSDAEGYARAFTACMEGRNYVVK